MLDTLPALPDLAPSTTPDPDAGFGALSTARGSLPLEALDVRARIDGLIAGVEVCQTFVNAHDEPLEATYVFPLPDRAAVTSFRLEVAGRVVEGMLQERGQARRDYDAALQAGHRAAIAEEERPGVFTMRVGNLPPGERAIVRLGLVGPLPYSDGEATFRFPLVVAPRYIPGTPLPGPAVGAGVAADTDRVPDASRISPPVLLPGFPNPVRLGITVEVPDSPLAPHSFRSSLHAVVEQEQGVGRLFRIRPGERLDRDFVLRWRLAGDHIQTSLAVRPDPDGGEGTFLLTLVPLARTDEANAPRDLVFVLDRSGSMSGWKMVAARRAVARMVETLTEHDRFTVYAFDDSIETPPGFDGLALVPASDRQRFRAAEFLAAIDARGGTEMAAPLEKAVAELGRAPTADRILVLITDGQVGNEDDILKRLGGRVQGIRIFTLGIDRAVNAAFLRRLADLGGGASEVVESEQRLDEVMDQVHRHVGTPVLTEVSLRPAGLEVVPDSVVPARLPDLFAGAPVLISGRYRGAARGALVLRGKDEQGQPWATEVVPCVAEQAPLERVWARGRVRELEDRYVIHQAQRTALEKEIVATSLRFGVLSRFTAFLAVDRSEVVNPGGEGKKITQAVEQPAGWGQRETLAACPAPSAPAGGRALKIAALRRAAQETRSASAASRRPAAPPASAPEDQAPPQVGRFRQLMDALGEALPGPAGFAYQVEEDGGDGQARSRKKPRREPEEAGGGLWQRVKSFFGRSSDEPSDPQTLRACVEDLRRRLEGVPIDAAARLEALRACRADLEALLEGGDGSPPFARLAALLARLPALLQVASPADDQVHELWQGIVTALRDYLNPAGAAPRGGAGREGFWK